jgi:ubiquinone/menaquinone biosynthesis C-methylase UbiE
MPRNGVGFRVALRRKRNDALKVLGRAASRVLSALPAGGRARRFLAERTWAYLPSDVLDAYLVSGYQNPRINVQSILVRHILTRRLFGDEFDELMDEEIRFALRLNEVLRLRALEHGVRMGSFIDPVRHADVKMIDAAINGVDVEFIDRWRTALAERQAVPVSVLEFACGSANDYRGIDESGLGRFLDYHGIDLTAKNIANARRHFPDVDFEIGDVTSLRYPDASFDYVIASDLFEHLSIDAMGRALDQAARLARRAIILTFFSMSDIPEHVVRPKAAYYWNRLSRWQVEAVLRERFLSVTATPIAQWLADQYEYRHSYNRNAWTIVAERPVVESATPPRTVGFKARLITIAASLQATAVTLTSEAVTFA